MGEKNTCTLNKITIEATDLVDLIGWEKARVLDKNNISWKKVNGEWLGKRCVSWKDGFAYGWLEDMPKDEKVKYWLHGEDADYNELFKKELMDI